MYSDALYKSCEALIQPKIIPPVQGHQITEPLKLRIRYQFFALFTKNDIRKIGLKSKSQLEKQN